MVGHDTKSEGHGISCLRDHCSELQGVGGDKWMRRTFDGKSVRHFPPNPEVWFDGTLDDRRFNRREFTNDRHVPYDYDPAITETPSEKKHRGRKLRRSDKKPRRGLNE